MFIHARCWFALALSLGAVMACRGDSNAGGEVLLDRGSCDVLIECAASLAPAARDEYEQAYGANGTCWQSGPNSWPACRDFCETTLDALNLVAMANGGSCGGCASDADCSEFGEGFTCVGGLCSGGSGESAEDVGDGDGDGDGDACVDQPEECALLLACLAIVLPEVNNDHLAPGGSCWCETQAQADGCTLLCEEQWMLVDEQFPDVPECGGVACELGTYGCPCAEFGNCDEGLECFNGTCDNESGGFGDPCVNNNDCFVGLVCIAGKCSLN